MRDFFSSFKFKLLLSIMVLIAGVMAYAAANGRLSAAPQELLAAAMAPFQRLSASISYGLQGVVEKYVTIDKIVAENEELKTEIAEVRSQLIDYDKLQFENEQYREAFKIADENPSFTFVKASVMARDPMEKFYAFTIDKGSNSGVQVENAVISPQGVVGKVIEVGPNYAKVATILDPTLNIGAMISSTRDNGIITGDGALSQKGQCKLTYISRETLATQGDIIITTGLGGVFPQGLDVGTIADILPESSGTIMYGVINPSVDIENVKMVFIITSFENEETPPTE
ncbi:MAG: rod shape-determining protein MreC [Oscillospiraceae bacterium]|nr:rod shape-determining protein MreC [Oscillospiraceae bacterium]